MVTGVVASIVMNWILWPFVARHDLRKGMSATLFYCSIIYRSKLYRGRALPPICADISEVLCLNTYITKLDKSLPKMI